MKIAVIGAGNMARAIIRAVKNAGRMPVNVFCAYDRFQEQLNEVSKLGALTANRMEEVVRDADFVLFAVKPQDLDGVILELKDCCADFDKKVYITICAGISSAYICNALGVYDLPVVRVMPNAPMMIGAGATAITRNKYVNDKTFSKICGIFSFGGEVVSIPENQMNAMISVNSSSPAYFYEFVRIMIEYAKTKGIDEKVARIMAQNAMYGAAKVLMSSEKSLEEQIAVVKSKKGTTEAALDSFKSNEFERIIFDAMNACTKRAEELGK